MTLGIWQGLKLDEKGIQSTRLNQGSSNSIHTLIGCYPFQPIANRFWDEGGKLALIGCYPFQPIANTNFLYW
jgi:hypothetical protein